MTIGQDITPGIVTEVESLPAISVGGLSTANVMLVGQGNVSESEAEPNQPYTVTRSSQVREYFGSDNMLSGAVNDALDEGALPVYAILTDEENRTEAVDTESGTVQHTPLTENEDEIEFSEGGTQYDVHVVYSDPTTETPEANEVYINPVTGDYQLESTPTDGEIVYTSFDYQSALDSVESEDVEDIDYLYVLNENENVQDALESTLSSLESYHEFVIGGIGVSPTLETVSDYTARFDNSRMQLFYPSRNNSGETIMGAIGGLKARLGINGSAMNKRLSTHDRLIDRIDFNDEEHLLSESTVPVASQTRGSLIVDDPTCVDDENTAEANMSDGYSRLVVDRVTEITYESERQFVGKLNKPATRGSLQSEIRTGISFLEEQDAVLDYNVRVHEGDSMTAYVDVQVDTVDPLRNIYNTISVGQ